MGSGRRGKVSKSVVLFLCLVAGLGVALPAHTPTATQLFVYEDINYGDAFMGFNGLREEPDLRAYNIGARAPRTGTTEFRP
ncbi:MAG: hypothetical protein ACP5VN_10475 [Acidobacteriota bacterium]